MDMSTHSDSPALAYERGYDFKLMSDPALVRGAQPVYRINVRPPGNDCTPAEKQRDPRGWAKILHVRKPRVTLQLKVPRYTIDDDYVGVPPSTCLLMRNVNNNVDEPFLRKLAEKYGKILKIRICLHPKTNKHLGMAQVSYDCAEAALRFMKAYNNKPLMGQILEVVDDSRGDLIKKLFHEKLMVPNHPTYPSSYIAGPLERPASVQKISASYVPFIPSSESLERQKRVNNDFQDSYYVGNDGNDENMPYNEWAMPPPAGYVKGQYRDNYNSFTPRYVSTPSLNSSMEEMPPKNPRSFFNGRAQTAGRGRKNFNTSQLSQATKRQRSWDGTAANETPKEEDWGKTKTALPEPTRERTPDWDDLDADAPAHKPSSSKELPSANGINRSPPTTWAGPGSNEHSQPQAVPPRPARERTPDWDEDETEPSSNTQTKPQKPVLNSPPAQSTWGKQDTKKQALNDTHDLAYLAPARAGIKQQLQPQPVPPHPARERTPDWDEDETEPSSNTQTKPQEPVLDSSSSAQSAWGKQDSNEQMTNGYGTHKSSRLALAEPGVNQQSPQQKKLKRPRRERTSVWHGFEPPLADPAFNQESKPKRPRRERTPVWYDSEPTSYAQTRPQKDAFDPSPSQSAWGKPATNMPLTNGYDTYVAPHVAWPAPPHLAWGGQPHLAYPWPPHLGWAGPGIHPYSHPPPVHALPAREHTPGWNHAETEPTWGGPGSYKQTQRQKPFSGRPPFKSVRGAARSNNGYGRHVSPQAAWAEPKIDQQSQPQPMPPRPERERTPDWDEDETELQPQKNVLDPLDKPGTNKQPPNDNGRDGSPAWAGSGINQQSQPEPMPTRELTPDWDDPE